jgi:uncharacterized membrane protein YjjB (DUF3815 family)
VPSGLLIVHEGRSRLVRCAATGIDLSVQARIARAVLQPHQTPALQNGPTTSGAPNRSAFGESALWCLQGLTVAIAMGGTDGTVLSAGALGLSMGLLMVAVQRWSSLGPLATLIGALITSIGASLLSLLWTFDGIVAPIAAIIVLLPGWSLTVGVGEVATGHLASGSARLIGAFVTVLQLALGWVAGAELVARSGLSSLASPELLGDSALPGWLGMLGVAVCLSLMFRAEGRHWGLVGIGVLLGWGSSFLPMEALARSFAGALALGLAGTVLTRATGLPAQLVTVPGVMVMVPGGTLLVSALSLVQHTPGGGEALVDAFGVAGALVVGLLAARLVPLGARLPSGSSVGPGASAEPTSPCQSH